MYFTNEQKTAVSLEIPVTASPRENRVARVASRLLDVSLAAATLAVARITDTRGIHPADTIIAGKGVIRFNGFYRIHSGSIESWDVVKF